MCRQQYKDRKQGNGRKGINRQMKITILAVGKLKEKYFTDAVQEYSKRLGRYCKLEIIETADEKTPGNTSTSEGNIIRAKEAGRLKKYIIADEKISFSLMTFPHQLMRVILLEQVYRAYRIINGEPYHK